MQKEQQFWAMHKANCRGASKLLFFHGLEGSIKKQAPRGEARTTKANQFFRDTQTKRKKNNIKFNNERNRATKRG